jgi:hypothetical protein
VVFSRGKAHSITKRFRLAARDIPAPPMVTETVIRPGRGLASKRKPDTQRSLGKRRVPGKAEPINVNEAKGIRSLCHASAASVPAGWS